MRKWLKGLSKDLPKRKPSPIVVADASATSTIPADISGDSDDTISSLSFSSSSLSSSTSSVIVVKKTVSVRTEASAPTNRLSESQARAPSRGQKIDVRRDIGRAPLGKFERASVAETIVVYIQRGRDSVDTGAIIANSVHARAVTRDPGAKGYTTFFPIWMKNGVVHGGTGPSQALGLYKNRLHVESRSVFFIGFKRAGDVGVTEYRVEVDIKPNRERKNMSQVLYDSRGTTIGFGFDPSPKEGVYVFRYLFVSN